MNETNEQIQNQDNEDKIVKKFIIKEGNIIC